jgi:hypothetical protein
MNKPLKFLLLMLLAVFAYSGSKAQQNVVGAGGMASGSNGNVSYSVGQLFYEQQNTSQYSLLPGVQQPYEISVITSNPLYEGIHLDCSVFPNPTADVIHLKIEDNKFTDWNYQLHDLNGKRLSQGIIVNNQTVISLMNQPPGSYFLKVSMKAIPVKTFKIIKIQ